MVLLTFAVITIRDVEENMARKIAALLLLVAYGSCMEMRETVERMVMVRTTGSDLQPAATGYIYKKNNDGHSSVVKMGESEIMEQLSKLYEKPEAYSAAAPAAAGSFHTKEEDENKAASAASETYIKPVVEKDEHADGIADDDYDKIFSGYGSGYDDYKKGFADYLHGLKHYDNGHGHEHGGGKDYGSKGHHEYGDKGFKGFKIIHHYGKGDAGDYHTEKYGSFAISKEGGHKKVYDEADDYGKHYAEGHGYKGADHGNKGSHSKGEEVDGYHKVYDKNEFKKDHDFYDGEGHKGGYHKHGDGHAYHGSDAGKFEKGGSHDSGQHKGEFGKGGFVEKKSGDEHGAEHSAEEGGESSGHGHREFGIEEGKHGGKGYVYEIKH